MTLNELTRRFPNASAAFIAANCEASRPVIKPIAGNESVAAKKGKGGDTNRFRVCVVSYRRRLCDADNLCPKYFIDCCKYAGAITDDAPKYITLEVSQQKVKGKENERTEILIERIN